MAQSLRLLISLLEARIVTDYLPAADGDPLTHVLPEVRAHISQVIVIRRHIYPTAQLRLFLQLLLRHPYLSASPTRLSTLSAVYNHEPYMQARRVLGQRNTVTTWFESGEGWSVREASEAEAWENEHREPGLLESSKTGQRSVRRPIDLTPTSSSRLMIDPLRI